MRDGLLIFWWTVREPLYGILPVLSFVLFCHLVSRFDGSCSTVGPDS